MHTAARGEHPGWGETAPLARRPLPTPQPREAPPVTREAASQPEMLCRRAGDGGGLTRTLLQSASQGDLLLGRMGGTLRPQLLSKSCTSCLPEVWSKSEAVACQAGLWAAGGEGSAGFAGLGRCWLVGCGWLATVLWFVAGCWGGGLWASSAAWGGGGTVVPAFLPCPAASSVCQQLWVCIDWKRDAPPPRRAVRAVLELRAGSCALGGRLGAAGQAAQRARRWRLPAVLPPQPWVRV